MARIVVSREMAVDTAQAWRALSNLASHSSWMKDAASIAFSSELRSGVGTVMEVKTKVGPFRTNDVMEVTGWKEGEAIEVSHRGLVRGTGVLSVTPTDRGARIDWVEDLTFPWWLGGPITAYAARPVLTRIWRGNLARFEAAVGAD